MFPEQVKEIPSRSPYILNLHSCRHTVRAKNFSPLLIPDILPSRNVTHRKKERSGIVLVHLNQLFPARSGSSASNALKFFASRPCQPFL